MFLNRLSTSSLPRRLLLWDIDGTMVYAGKAGGEAMLRALNQIYGPKDYTREGVRLGGRCDSMIAKEVAMNAGIDENVFSKKFSDFHEEYAVQLHEIVTKDPEAIQSVPGISVLFEKLLQEQYISLGLVTGNLEKIAHLKLRGGGFRPDWFPIASYGSDASDRLVLPRLALQRASDLFKVSIPSHKALIIGDTVEDIQCAQANNIPILAVGTGCTSVEELHSFSPDYALDTLEDTELVLSILRRDQ